MFWRESARRVSSIRELIPSLVNAWRRWVPTVCGEVEPLRGLPVGRAGGDDPDDLQLGRDECVPTQAAGHPDAAAPVHTQFPQPAADAAVQRCAPDSS